MIILELLRVVDNNGNDTNEILEREELHNGSKLHNEVTIYIINNTPISPPSSLSPTPLLLHHPTCFSLLIKKIQINEQRLNLNRS